MSGTVPPPPPGQADRPPSVPPSSPATGVRRVVSAYRRPTSADPDAEVPLQQVTAPSAAARPEQPSPQVAAAATAVHAPVPPAPAPTAHAPVPPPPVAPQAYTPGYAAHQTHAPTQAQPAYAAATQVQQPVYAQPAPAPQGPAGPYPAAAAPPQPPPPRRKRRLSAGWIAFIAVDVVLIAVAVFFAVQILTSSSPESPEAGAQESATPTPTVSESAPAQSEEVAAFAAPSKNITCTIYTDGASCGIAELNQQPAPTEGCDGTTGYVVTVDGEGQVAQPCVPADEQPKAAGGDADVLDYGDSITEGDFTCTSDETGMACTHDPTGKGFSLARAGIGTS